MVDKKISGLTAGSAVAATDLLPAVETVGVGPVYKTAAQIKTFTSAAPTLLATAGQSAVTLTGGTQTLSFPIIDATQTWNAAGVAFSAVKVAVTNTASASGSTLAEFAVGGTTVASVVRTNTGGNYWRFGVYSVDTGAVSLGVGGSAAAGPSNGFIQVDANTFQIAAGGAGVFGVRFLSDTVDGGIGNAGVYAFRSGVSGANDLYLGRQAAATLRLGAPDVDLNANIVAQFFRPQGALAGGTSNQAGKDWTFQGSPGKGTGVGGGFIFQTTPAGGSGTAVNTQTTALKINDTQAVLAISPTGGMGYGTGAGGAVTQATSRTTGVTLNKVTGAITLFTAAGSATPASFTVTNSTVAATDVVNVSVKSATTNKYAVIITAVAAGSFEITFWAVSGTTSDAPVFNFAVQKAVAA